MIAGSGRVVVGNIAPRKCLMKVLIYLEKEVFSSAVDDETQSGTYFVYLIDNGVALPRLLVGIIIAECFADFPSGWERSYVHSSRHGAAPTEHVLMAYGVPHGTMSAHAEPCDGALAWFAEGGIVVVDVIDKFVRDESFEAHFRIDGTVKIPRPFSVRAYNNHLQLCA